MSKFVYFNPNPSYKPFKNGKDKIWTIEDDNVRVICKLLDCSWEDAFNIISNKAKSMYDVMSSKKVFKEIIEDDNKMVMTSFGKPKMNEKRPTVEEFCNEHQFGTYILNLASKVVIVIDGQLYDTEDCSKSSVYSWWTKKL